MRVPGSVHTSVCPTVCQHSRRLPNCLPTSPKMAQPSAYKCIAKLFANIAEHHSTVCQHFWRWPNFLLTLPNCLPSMSYTGQLFASFAEHRPTVLPTSCHSDHQIKSVRFLFGFLFFPSVIVWFCVFYFFTGCQLAALYIWMMAAEILEIWIWTGSVSSGYIFYVLVTIVSFFLIVETREGMLVCFKKIC